MPLPPTELMRRVGSPPPDVDVGQFYLDVGETLRAGIESCLPDDWDWDGKRVLDFGSGAGRTLRQFAPEAERGEFWGCDLDAPSIEWAQRHLSPPLKFVLNDEDPPLPLPDEHFDLVLAMSVYTHLADNWSAWLEEHQRIVRPGGYLLATYLGGRMGDLYEQLFGEPRTEDRIGMRVNGPRRGWDEGGPVVFHSDWWIRTHWGRAFEIERLWPGLPGAGTGPSHSLALLRRRPGPVVPWHELETPEPGEPRESSSLRTPRASVVTAVEHGHGDAGVWLDALLGQTADPDAFEVLVSDTGGDGEWREAFARRSLGQRPLRRFTYTSTPPSGRAAALNRALAEAAGETVIFLAHDFVPGADFVETHLRFHEEHPELEAVAVGDAVVPASAGSDFVRWLERTGRLFGVPLDSGSGAIPPHFFYVGNSSVKRGLLDRAGPLDDEFPYDCWDDHELGQRLAAAGMHSRLLAGATVTHEHPITLRERRRSAAKAGESAAIAERKMPPPHPWADAGEVPVWRWRLAAWKWRLAHLVTRRAEHRERHWDRSLTASYAAGLRAGRRRLGQAS